EHFGQLVRHRGGNAADGERVASGGPLTIHQSEENSRAAALPAVIGKTKPIRVPNPAQIATTGRTLWRPKMRPVKISTTMSSKPPITAPAVSPARHPSILTAIGRPGSLVLMRLSVSAGCGTVRWGA